MVQGSLPRLAPSSDANVGQAGENPVQSPKSIFVIGKSGEKDGWARADTASDGRTDGRTDGWTNGRTDGQTNVEVEIVI